MTSEKKPTGPAVYRAIAVVQAELSRDGIGKGHRNQQQGYTFRGIDDVYNALAPIMSKAGLCMLPEYSERETVERLTQKGSPLFYTTVKGTFTFVSAEDGSSHQITTYGEAMDTADKSTNKAMSAALKYACLQGFLIPTEGDNDADATTPSVAAQERRTQISTAPKDEKPRDPNGITEAQGKKIWAMATGLFGADSAKERLKRICIGQQLPESSKDMTTAQASTLIEFLAKMEKERG